MRGILHFFTAEALRRREKLYLFTVIVAVAMRSGRMFSDAALVRKMQDSSLPFRIAV